MIITLALLFAALGIISYKLKEYVSLIEDFHTEENLEEKDLYKDLEDLFI